MRKVVKTLNWIEQRIGALAEKIAIPDEGELGAAPETEEERRDREQILNGPQMKGQGVTQDAVDDFFASSDQSDIDKLFD